MTVCKKQNKPSSGWFKNVIFKMCLEIIFVVDNGQYAIEPNQTKPNHIY